MKIYPIIIAIAITLLFQTISTAQQKEDLALIFSSDVSLEKETHSSAREKRKRIAPYLFKPGYLLFEKVVYPQMGFHCFYENRCTDFCGDLIEEFGLAKGYFISIDRIARCNRLAPLETYPSRLTSENKLIDRIADYRNH